MGKRRILLADDSVTIQKVVSLTFADEGFDVVSVSDGNAAVERIAAGPPDLVLADVHMPGLNGYEVCELIRQSESTRDLPVILLVGSFEPFDENEAARVGANAHLTKPFQSIRLLVDKVAELVPAEPENAAEHDELFQDTIPITPDTLRDAGMSESEGSESLEGPGGGMNIPAPPEPSRSRVDAYSEPLRPISKDSVDTSDIDDLYSASFAETVEIPPGDEAPVDFVDAGMDDEMIEKSYTAGGDGAASYPEPDLEFGPPPAPLSPRYGDDVEATGQRSPFDDLAEPESVSRASEPDDAIGSAERSEASYGQTAPQFNDIELLELPPSADEVEEPITFTVPEKAAFNGTADRAVAISDELMELIVQKVIDRLSER